MASEIIQYFITGPEVVTSRTENCDNSSLENDTEMLDHSMNHKFEGASYDYGY